MSVDRGPSTAGAPSARIHRSTDSNRMGTCSHASRTMGASSCTRSPSAASSCYAIDAESVDAIGDLTSLFINRHSCGARPPTPPGRPQTVRPPRLV
ncbi:hypothetical protein EVAR_92111_1 [Eumeta japonica]|uniref:Uncharacterized protein n=1 Tax=Eumeta variegata TaxID=151549 RepID=A0A4C1SZ96_EUMVA|nr:hypothetical protein EVAR_92111_1 [Eumeta japonica]